MSEFSERSMASAPSKDKGDAIHAVIYQSVEYRLVEEIAVGPSYLRLEAELSTGGRFSRLSPSHPIRYRVIKYMFNWLNDQMTLNDKD